MVVGVLLIVGVGAALTMVIPIIHHPVVSVSSIKLQGFDLCSANCVYPSPHLSGLIIFNGTAPLKSLQLIVNGTDQVVQKWNGTNLTTFALDYKGGFTNPAVVKGDAYTIEFVAIFEDNSTASAQTSVIAD